jgi:hypothetical protein
MLLAGVPSDAQRQSPQQLVRSQHAIERQHASIDFFRIVKVTLACQRAA